MDSSQILMVVFGLIVIVAITKFVTFKYDSIEIQYERQEALALKRSRRVELNFDYRTIAVEDAFLCINCDKLHDQETCPICMSTVSISIRKFIGSIYESTIREKPTLLHKSSVLEQSNLVYFKEARSEV